MPNAINRDTPSGKDIHVILDNYAAHKHAKVRAWLEAGVDPLLLLASSAERDRQSFLA